MILMSVISESIVAPTLFRPELLQPGSNLAIIGPGESYQISVIKTHLVGPIRPPGRSAAQGDAPASGKHRPNVHRALRRADRPHRRPRSCARSPRRGSLMVQVITAQPAPNERAQDRGEMGLYHRDLV